MSGVSSSLRLRGRVVTSASSSFPLYIGLYVFGLAPLFLCSVPPMSRYLLFAPCVHAYRSDLSILAAGWAFSVACCCCVVCCSRCSVGFVPHFLSCRPRRCPLPSLQKQKCTLPELVTLCMRSDVVLIVGPGRHCRNDSSVETGRELSLAAHAVFRSRCDRAIQGCTHTLSHAAGFEIIDWKRRQEGTISVLSSGCRNFHWPSLTAISSMFLHAHGSMQSLEDNRLVIRVTQ